MDHPSAPLPVDNPQHVQEGIFNGPVHLARGRQARDPQAKTVTYSVASLEEFESCLREYLATLADRDPEHTECQLSFWIGTSFLVSAPDPNPQQQQHQQPQQPRLSSQPHLAQHPDAAPGYQPANGIQYGAPNPYQNVSDPAIALTLQTFPQQSPPSNPDANGAGNASNTPKKLQVEHKVSMSILEALQPTEDPKEKMRKQRAIAKSCVDAIQRSDGFRYSFHNCWNSREDDSFRFSYYCNDSLLNKDRAANGKGAKLGKRATKPVYDCKGVLSVKFSASKQSLDVFYKHVPIHKTYEERAPPPRKDSKRRKYLEENDPEALSRIQNRPKSEKRESDPAAPPKPSKKRKKPEETKPSSTSLESDLRAQSLRSLLELIRPDPAPEPSFPVQHAPQPPPPPPPSQPQPAAHVDPKPANPPQMHGQAQAPAHAHAHAHVQQTRKRPRNSCDVCKAKKTKVSLPRSRVEAPKAESCWYLSSRVFISILTFS